MSRRTIAIIIFIVGILMLAVVAVIFITSQNQPPETVTPAEGTAVPGEEAPPGEAGGGVEAEATLPPTPSNVIEVVVSLQTVPRGYQITEDILTTEMRDASKVGLNVITNVEDVVGKYARDDIFQGETITVSDIVDDVTTISQEEFGPSSIIPPGFVAQAIPLNDISSVAYGVSEGDYVDIMLLFSLYQIDQEFQTLLPNDAAFYLEEGIQAADQAGVSTPEADSGGPPAIIYGIVGFGRFEELATGDLAHIGPNNPQRPVYIGVLIQNAKVVQVGKYTPPPSALDLLPTATPEPVAEGEATPTPGIEFPTATPEPPDVVLLAMQPQQQLLLRYAIEVGVKPNLALRNVDDGQLYAVDNVDLEFFLQRFNIELPPDLGFTVDTQKGGTSGGGSAAATMTPTSEPTPEG